MPPPIDRPTITYRKPGTKPPVYLAGSFTEPQWVPQQMNSTREADGEYVFTAQISAVPGREYQYKFRLGEHDRWVLDDHWPVVTDDMGNENNLLSLPRAASSKAAKRAHGKVLNEHGIVEMDSRSPTPIEQVADTAAEVATTAEKLDQCDEVDYASNAMPLKTQDRTEPSQRPPLFAHECFGCSEYVADGLDHTDLSDDSTQPSRQRRMTPGVADPEEVDMDDPTIERFPSQRKLVLDVLRKIQSSSHDDQVVIDHAPTSPHSGSRRESIDSAEDSPSSTEPLSPTSPMFLLKRDNRLSSSSYGMSKSAVSLTSIAEEPKGDQPGSRKLGKAPPKPKATKVFERLETPPTDEEDLIAVGEVTSEN